MILKEFIFTLRSLEGAEYEIAVPARKEADAERLLKNYIDIMSPSDKIVSLKASRAEH